MTRLVSFGFLVSNFAVKIYPISSGKKLTNAKEVVAKTTLFFCEIIL